MIFQKNMEEKSCKSFQRKINNGVYGLLGANGAGKTTLMRMICDVQTETKGAIFLTGKTFMIWARNIVIS